jgi:hypothetical protein
VVLKRSVIISSLVLGSLLLILIVLGAVVSVRVGTGLGSATLFDWLEVLIFPLTIALAVLWLTNRAQKQQANATAIAQRQREEEREERNRQREREEQMREEHELEIANQRTQDTALQTYIDQIGRLLLDRDLRGSAPLSEVSLLARAYTLTILEGLDPNRKRSVVRFLYEAGLLLTPTITRTTIVRLQEADLSYAALANMHMYLGGINLEGANLQKADLSNTRLSILEEI